MSSDPSLDRTVNRDFQFAALQNRALLRIGGEDATKFLQGIVTCEVEKLAEGQAAFGALLSPQGKILFDFFLLREGAGYLVETGAAHGEALQQRLNFYKLRAKVDISPEETAGIFAIWGNAPVPSGKAFRDPRHTDLGWRIYGASPKDGVEASYDCHRIAIGIPAGGMDFAYGDAFPHEALMDQFAGVDFTKGCFVGQEVVSRMQHRGTARKRVVQVRADLPLPGQGAQIRAGATTIGMLGSVCGKTGLALVRTDRAARAKAQNEAILADDQPITLHLQEFVRFGWPEIDSPRESPSAR